MTSSWTDSGTEPMRFIFLTRQSRLLIRSQRIAPSVCISGWGLLRPGQNTIPYLALPLQSLQPVRHLGAGLQ